MTLTVNVPIVPAFSECDPPRLNWSILRFGNEEDQR